MRADKYKVVQAMGLQFVDYSGMDSIPVKSEGSFTKKIPCYVITLC